ncbi:multiple coagulation factor deficiency protein 2 homolog [Argiope bruennichi]|uniref:Multiple coagulation factor deficiency like protein n=1 Tax=Argiope bruennichi TaxID=94029 RepID=A0A8T0F8Y3_ARGBR|nr:multiple coagulation factor deficiency protein 2 homolog [Argiope bruennichi]KAF8787674.1 Multiple coagulation factor deficiency like protein [Argiope bruennichi]
MCVQIVSILALCFFSYAMCDANHSHHEPTLITSKSHLDERHHIEHHMNGVTDQDVNQMTDDELQFLYFKMHDSDNNDKLDGCELVKSLLHWHVEEHNDMVPDLTVEGTTRIFGHEELAVMIDPILSTDDKNLDGFIDYVEFSTAQKSRGF